MKRIQIDTPNRSYPVLIGADLNDPLNRLLKKHISAGRLFVLIDANVYALHGRKLGGSLHVPRGRRLEFVIPSGESSKSESALSGVYDFLLDHEIRRDDFILAVGGGVTSDLAGYAAATVLRGVRWGILPTTLLSMADASIGGKTGINQARGKNLIGAFWQPAFVCGDVNFLMTLPRRHMIAGLGEIVKVAGLSSKDAVNTVRQYLSSGDLFDLPMLTRMIYSAAAFKSSIVSRDEREFGPRMILNFGHTFAHGIERALGYGRLLHGEAVVVGIDAALALGERLGYPSAGLAEYRSLITNLMSYLPKRKIDVASVIEAMRYDKKHSLSSMRFVLLEQVGRPVLRERITRVKIRASLKEAVERYYSLGGGHV